MGYNFVIHLQTGEHKTKTKTQQGHGRAGRSSIDLQAQPECSGPALSWDIIAIFCLGTMVTTALLVIIDLFQYIWGNYHLGKKPSFIYICTKKLVMPKQKEFTGQLAKEPLGLTVNPLWAIEE